jgi:dCTP deaminase
MMYLSNRDIRWAIQCKHLFVDPPPETFGAGYDENSLDLHLGPVERAQVWNIAAYTVDLLDQGIKAPELSLGSLSFLRFGEKYLSSPPEESDDPAPLVSRRGKQVIVKPGGFLLWTTKEWVGTPQVNPSLICYVNAKSTRARTGIIVHFTAPTIHAGWEGNITLEIANHGPFHFILEENDVIAQLTVAHISSTPDPDIRRGASQTAGQRHPSGAKE